MTTRIHLCLLIFLQALATDLIAGQSPPQEQQSLPATQHVQLLGATIGSDRDEMMRRISRRYRRSPNCHRVDGNEKCTLHQVIGRPMYMHLYRVPFKHVSWVFRGTKLIQVDVVLFDDAKYVPDYSNIIDRFNKQYGQKNKRMGNVLYWSNDDATIQFDTTRGAISLRENREQ